MRVVSVPCGRVVASNDVPSINVLDNVESLGLRMGKKYVLHDPSDEMILEGTLDDLMKKVGCEKFVNVGAWKPGCEGLENDE